MSPQFEINNNSHGWFIWRDMTLEEQTENIFDDTLYLHSDLELRQTTYNGGVASGYFRTEQEAKTTLENYLAACTNPVKPDQEQKNEL